MDTLNAIKKQFIAKAEIDGDARTIIATITTEAIDRDGEVIIAKGIDFEMFLKNPVVLWAHNSYAPPIAKARWIKRKGKKIVAELIFAETEQAEEVFQLFKGGFLNAFSIGFIPKKGHQPTPDEIKKKPEWAEVWRVIDEAELLEFSAVPVPANPEALAIAVKNHEVKIDDLGIDLVTDKLTAQMAKDAWDSLDDEETFIADNKTEPTEEEVGEAIDSLLDMDIGIEAMPIEIKGIEIIAAPIKIDPYIDITAAVNEEIKKRRGIVYD